MAFSMILLYWRLFHSTCDTMVWTARAISLLLRIIIKVVKVEAAFLVSLFAKLRFMLTLKFRS